MNQDLSIEIPTNEVALRVEDPPDKKRRELLTLIPETSDEYLLVMDNSAIETFTTCPQYAYNYLVAGREAHARNAALTFGGACHVGWEGIELGLDDVTTAQHMLRYFTENPTPPDEYRTPQIALELMAHYRVRKTLPDYTWQPCSDAHGLLVERPFELPLGVVEVNTQIHLPLWPLPRFVSKIHIAWSGRIDLVASIHGDNHVVDNKTTSIAGDNFIQEFELSNATIGYVWAGRQLWPHLNLSKFCLNAAHLKKPVPGTSLVEKGPRGGAPALNFFRAFFTYSDMRLAQWEDNAMTLVEDFITCLVRQRFPLHTKWCFAKFGKCQYHDVCAQDDPVVRANMLASDMYKNVTWNPTATR